MLSALFLLLAISYGAHWAYELLRPLVPIALTVIPIGLIIMAIVRRRRW